MITLSNGASLIVCKCCGQQFCSCKYKDKKYVELQKILDIINKYSMYNENMAILIKKELKQ